LVKTEQFWLARFGHGGWPPADHGPGDVVFESDSRNSRPLRIRGADRGESVAIADDCGVFLDGVIHDRRGLLRIAPRAGAESDAELIRCAYRELGPQVVQSVHGFFTLLIWDGRRGTLLGARDALGVYPLFFAQDGGCFLLSPSPEVLVGRGGVPADVDRVSVAGWALNAAIDVQHTFYQHVRRVPQGHVLEVDVASFHARRYWHPGRLGPGLGEMPTPDEAVQRFGELIGQAVDRCLAFGPASVYLSGGVDSGTVAAVAAARSRARSLPDPLALSLVFPGLADEESVQRAVAADLCLTQVVASLAEAAGARGVLAAGLEMSAWNWLPCINPWEASYNFLALEAKRRGCGVVLTGEGGNHWLEVDWLLAADLFRTLDIMGLVELWRSEQKYFPRHPATLARRMLWNAGLRPLARDALGVLLSQAAPSMLARLRRRRSALDIPNWAAPDAALREEMIQRSLAKAPPTPFEGYYARGRQRLLEGSDIAVSMETGFPIRERFGVWRLNPFFDPDLVAFLYAAPPDVLRLGGRAKGLAHATFERYVDEARAKQLRPVSANEVLDSLVSREGPSALRGLGGTPMLSELGIVNAEQIRRAIDGTGKNREVQYYEIWQILACEAWLQARFLGGVASGTSEKKRVEEA
jgi:hypothetical protein